MFGALARMCGIWAQTSGDCTPSRSRHSIMALSPPARRMGTVKKKVRCSGCFLLWDFSDLASLSPAICSDCLGVVAPSSDALDLPDTHSRQAARRAASTTSESKTAAAAAGARRLGNVVIGMSSSSAGACGSGCAGSCGRPHQGATNAAGASLEAERRGQKRARALMKRPAAAA